MVYGISVVLLRPREERVKIWTRDGRKDGASVRMGVLHVIGP